MNNISFKAETIKGEIIEACCVINKHDRLLLSNEAKAGFWIECKPDTLQVITKKTREGFMKQKVIIPKCKYTNTLNDIHLKIVTYKDYWLFTEVFCLLHDNNDFCNCR